MNKLERYEGHFLNWYNIQTLDPLYPRYVSTVDSGNLIACFWTLEQGLQQLNAAPILPLTALDGPKDTLAILYNTEKHSVEILELIQVIDEIINKPTSNITAVIKTIRKAITPAQQLENKLKQIKNSHDESLYWASQLHKQIKMWDALVRRYLSWLDTLSNAPKTKLHELGPDAQQWYLKALNIQPSLQTLAEAPLPELRKFLELYEKRDQLQLSPEINEWLKNLSTAASTAQWLAGERLAQTTEIFTTIQQISNSTNMNFLYNEDRKVFAIGFQVDNRRLDSSYYDLLASEARIASLVSIAKGDVPIEHWWSLARPYTLAYGRRVLLSWGGTMFEYLMPLLFNKFYKDSLLGNGCEAAVACQIDYGKMRGIPWGISESAYSEIDGRKIYQYRSAGVPGIGLKRDLEEDLVVSPYSTALALIIDAKAAIKNLKKEWLIMRIWVF